MSVERIPAIALHLALAASDHLSDAIGELLEKPRQQDATSVVDESFAKARSELDWDRVHSILGKCCCDDPWIQETISVAILLNNDALLAAWNDRDVWDGRRTRRTRRMVFRMAMCNHIANWTKERGVDAYGVVKLFEEGGEQ